MALTHNTFRHLQSAKVVFLTLEITNTSLYICSTSVNKSFSLLYVISWMITSFNEHIV